MDWSPAKLVQVLPEPISLRITSAAKIPIDQFRINFDVPSGAPSGFQLEATKDLSNLFEPVTFSLQTNGPGQYQITAPSSAEQKFSVFAPISESPTLF